MRCTHGWNHTDHITTLHTAPELTLSSRPLVRPKWLALIRLASRSMDSRRDPEGASLGSMPGGLVQDARSCRALASRDLDS